MPSIKTYLETTLTSLDDGLRSDLIYPYIGGLIGPRPPRCCYDKWLDSSMYISSLCMSNILSCITWTSGSKVVVLIDTILMKAQLLLTSSRKRSFSVSFNLCVYIPPGSNHPVQRAWQDFMNLLLVSKQRSKMFLRS
jgi:hypothetical protein